MKNVINVEPYPTSAHHTDQIVAGYGYVNVPKKRVGVAKSDDRDVDIGSLHYGLQPGNMKKSLTSRYSTYTQGTIPFQNIIGRELKR